MLLKTFAALLLTGAAATTLGYFALHKTTNKTEYSKPVPLKKGLPSSATAKYALPLEKLSTLSGQLKSFAARKGYNEELAFMVDMSIPSGRQRFFVYNMKKDSIELAGLVTHGYGSAKEGIQFSNVPGSYCSSLGRYKVGASYSGRFGLAFKLHGLDKTNDKAFERFVVLHAHDCVPEDEVEPLAICESQGCPTVSPAFLLKLKNYIGSSGKPILLNIYR